MEDKFNEIRKEYRELNDNMLRKGKLPLKDTGVGFWGGAIHEEIFEAFKKIGLHNYNSFIDLGSGDGRVVLIASLFGIKAVGIEYDNELFKISLDMQRKLNIPHALFYNNDFFEHSITGYDLVFINPDKPLEKGVEQKLSNEMTGKLILYGHHFHPKELEKEESFIINGNKVSVYANKKG